MISNDEIHLLNRVSYGDTHAFELLFKRYKNVTYSFAIRICQSKTLAEEVVQDVFLSIWTGRDRLNGINNFGGYLRVVTRNQALQVLRRLALETRSQAKSTENWQELHNETESTIQYNESRKILNKALDTLPPQQKLVYQLCHLQGMKQQEVAEQLHISPLTVKAHLRQAVQRVRASFTVETILILCLIIRILKKTS